MDEFRELLGTRFAIDPLSLSRFLNAPLGTILLERLLVLFRSTDPEATLKALRGALVVAAFDDAEGLSILNVLQKWPLREVELNFSVALDAIEAAEQLFVETEKISAGLRQQAVADSFAINLPDKLPNLRQMGGRTWSREELNFANPHRLGASHIAADLYLPSAGNDPAAVVVISHGFGSNRQTFARLAEHLASHGLAVAAIEHPATNSTSVSQFLTGVLTPVATDVFVERPRDISLLLDQLVAISAPGEKYHNRIDPSRVGVLGQSLGGYTALAIGGAQLDIEYLRQQCATSRQSLPFNLSIELQCQLLEAGPLEDSYSLRDDRVVAVMALNPVSSVIFGPAGMGTLQIPLTIVAGEDDFFAPAIPEQVYPYAWAGSEEKYLIYVERATHFSFLNDGQTEARAALLPGDTIGPDPAAAQPILQALTAAFFKQELGDASKLGGLYSNAYLRMVNRPPFRFFLSDSLSVEDLNQTLAAPLSEDAVDVIPIPFF